MSLVFCLKGFEKTLSKHLDFFRKFDTHKSVSGGYDISVRGQRGTVEAKLRRVIGPPGRDIISYV